MNNINSMLQKGKTKPDTLLELCVTDALDRLDEVCSSHFGPGPAILITDSTIWDAIGSRFASFVRARPGTTIQILPGSPAPYASYEMVRKIAGSIRQAGSIPIAVGSGTINDIVKRASFECRVPYLCVPTAPSVDGFAAYGAAITVDGFKTTLECPAPRCILADEDILIEAPMPLISAGFGDLMAKLTGGADWIVADIIGVEPIDTIAWDMVQPRAAAMLDKGSAVSKRDRSAVIALYGGLTASGLAMQRYRDSRPASGMEHLLSHTWEMGGFGTEVTHISHGFKVALGTLIAAAFSEVLFGTASSPNQKAELANRAVPRIGLRKQRMDLAQSLLADSPYREKALKAIAEKTSDDEGVAAHVGLAAEWRKELAARIQKQLPPFSVLRKALLDAGCPVEPGWIGLSREHCLKSVAIASLIRARYTMLDLAAELGLLEKAAESVFSSLYFSEYSR